MEVTRRRGRRSRKLLDYLKNRRGYSHLKEEALDLTMWRNRFGGGFGPVVRQNTNEYIYIYIFIYLFICIGSLEGLCLCRSVTSNGPIFYPLDGTRINVEYW